MRVRVRAFQFACMSMCLRICVCDGMQVYLHARYVVIGGMHCLLCFRAFLPIEVTCECVRLKRRVNA